MQSAYHNLPTIDGIMQKDGRDFAASEVTYQADDRAAEFSLNIATAYPAEAGLKRWKRSLRLDRRKNLIELRDEYALKRRASVISLTFMTPLPSAEKSPGEISFTGSNFPSGGVTLIYDAKSFARATEEIPLKDSRLRGAWGEKLYRIQLKAQNPADSGTWLFRITQRQA